MFPPGIIASQFELIEFAASEPPPDPAIPTGAARYWSLLFPANNGSDASLRLREVELLDALGGTVLSTGGTPSASTGTAATAFDGSVASGNYWSTSGTTAYCGARLSYDLGAGNEAVIGAARLHYDSDMRTPAGVVLESSSDGSTWTARGAVSPRDGTENAWNEIELDFLPRAYVCDGRTYRDTAVTSTTLTGLQFGPARADRAIIVGIVPTNSAGGSRSITGVTIGGETATLVASVGAAGTTPTEIWVARPTGGAGDVAVTCDASFDRLSVVAVHAMIPSLTPHQTDSDAAQILFDIPGDGFGLALLGSRISTNTGLHPGISDQGTPAAPSLLMAAGTYNQLQLSLEVSLTTKSKDFFPAVPLCGASWAF